MRNKPDADDLQWSVVKDCIVDILQLVRPDNRYEVALGVIRYFKPGASKEAQEATAMILARNATEERLS